MKTLIYIVLDRSGSMGGRESDTVGGINGLVADQKKIKGEADIALVRFDSVSIETFRPLEPISRFTPIGIHEVQARGGTPLLDAIGFTTDEADKVWKMGGYERGVLVIVTDGEENQSTKFSRAHIKERIERFQASGQWQIIYLGADVDAFREASQLGVMLQNSAGYTKSAKGMKVAFDSISASLSETRTTGSTVSSFLNKVNLGEDDGTS